MGVAPTLHVVVCLYVALGIPYTRRVCTGAPARYNARVVSHAQRPLTSFKVTSRFLAYFYFYFFILAARYKAIWKVLSSQKSAVAHMLLS